MRRIALALALCASFSIHAEETSPKILEVSLNQRDTHLVVTFWPGAGGLIANTTDWKELGVVLSSTEASKPKLSTVDLGATVNVNEDAQTVDITFPSDRLPKQDLSNSKSKQTLADPAKALLINYNLAGTKSFPGNYYGASLGHDIHFPLLGGVFSTSGQLNYNSTDGAMYRRLYTTWEKDNYSKLQSIQLGDVIAYGPGVGATSTNLAGIRWTKDPAGLDPLTPTYPLPTINGLAVDAGTLQVLANQSVIDRSTVNKGPFQIDALQAQAGLNILQSVVTDGYGRQTTVGLGSYYVAPTLLRSGLDTWDFSAGLIRRDYTDRYEGLGANLRYSKGLSDWTTVSAQTQASGEGENVSGTLVQKLGNYGVVTSSVAFSNSHTNLQQGPGWYGSVGYDYRAGNFGVHFQRYQQSDDFWQLHDPSSLEYQPRESTLFGGTWTSDNRQFGASVNYNDLRTSYAHFKQVLGSLSWGNHGHHLNLSAGFDLVHRSPSFMLSYTYTFRNSGVGASVANNNGERQEQVNGYWNHVSPSTQWGVQATFDKSFNNTFALINGNVNSNLGTGQVSYEGNGSNGSVNGTWSGAMVATSGGLSFTKNSQQGYVVVDVPNVPNIPVTLGGRVVATTNSSGVAVIGQVLTLAPVQIGLKDEAIPLGIDIENTQQKVSVAKLGGASVKFKVDSTDGRAFHLTHNSKDVEVGSATNEGDVVGFNGQLYLEHPPIGKSLNIKLKDGSTCTAKFPSQLPAYGGATDIECK